MGHDVNRDYFIHYVKGVASPGARVLDFGCGGGVLVSMLRDAGFDAYGVDVPDNPFIAEAATSAHRQYLRAYTAGTTLPFDDDSFDVVISDQVFEHVVPLESAVAEIDRVLKPGGRSYHHIPTLRVLREGHIGIPLSHRLPPGDLRLRYTTAMRRIGLGSGKDDRPARDWAKDKLDYIDRRTVYRSPAALAAAFGRSGTVQHREAEYCRFRARRVNGLLARILDRRALQRPVEETFRLLAFDAIEVIHRDGAPPE
jgi:SAM-dependent methyltransferase